MHSRGTQLNYAYLKTRIIAITITLLLTLPLLTHTTAIATTQPKVEWEKTYGGADNDFGHSVLETRDGGYIIVGSTWSFGAGKADVYLIKLGLGTALTTTPTTSTPAVVAPKLELIIVVVAIVAIATSLVIVFRRYKTRA